MWIHRARLLRPDEGGEGEGAESAPPEGAGAAPAGASPEAGKAEPESKAAPAWREDWREALAGDDPAALKQLGRYSSPQEVWKKAKSLESKISAGELRAVLPKNATAEQITEWRKVNGIPEKPEGYDIGATAKMDEATKGLLDKALPVAHALNLTQEQTKGVMKFLGDNARSVKEAQVERDLKAQEDGEEALRSEWGNEFKRNIGLIHNTLAAATSTEFKDKVLDARDADGKPLSSDPQWLKFLLHLSLVDNPAGKLVPGGGADAAKNVEERITEIEGKMGTKAYLNDDKMQAEYRELIDLRDKLKSRS